MRALTQVPRCGPQADFSMMRPPPQLPLVGLWAALALSRGKNLRDLTLDFFWRQKKIVKRAKLLQRYAHHNQSFGENMAGR